MKRRPIFLHAYYTWLASSLLYPAMVFCVTALMSTEPRFVFHPDMVWVYVNILITSLPYSVPGLLAGWICLGLISHTSLPVVLRFWVWLILEVVLTALGAALIIGFDHITAPQKLALVFPGAVAAAVVILVRRHQFKKLVCMYQERAASAEML